MSTQTIINGFKTLLSGFSPVDAGQFDEELNPAGAVGIQIQSVQPIQVGVPDWRLNVAFIGFTTADADPDKTKANALFTRLDAALEALTLSGVTAACGCNAALFKCTGKTTPSGESGREFSINYDLIVTDITL